MKSGQQPRPMLDLCLVPELHFSVALWVIGETDYRGSVNLNHVGIANRPLRRVPSGLAGELPKRRGLQADPNLLKDMLR